MITYKTLDIDGLWNKLDTYEIDPHQLVPRSQLTKITRRFQSDHVELIIGPRQSGKTTLLMMLMGELAQQGIPPRKIFYINLDTIDQMEQFKNPMLLVDQLDHFRERGERVYLFLDEAQRLETPGKFLKGLYDLNKKIKVFATGSSTLELRSKIKEFLTGRKRETHLYPLSFKEVIRRENKIPAAAVEVKLGQASTADWQKKEKLFGPYLTRIMEDMLIYGGYPAVLTTSDPEERKEELEEIYLSYIKKDIIDFLKVERTDVFNHLVKVLASQVGNLVNKSEICSLKIIRCKKRNCFFGGPKAAPRLILSCRERAVLFPSR